MLDIDKLIDVITIAMTALLIASFVIFDVIPGGRYIYLFLSIVILLLKTKGKFELKPEPYYIFNILMIAFTGASSLWAWNAYRATAMTKRMAVTFLCFALIYLAYEEDQDTRSLMKSFKWAGYLVMAYMVRSYGIARLRDMLMSSTRLSGDIGNTNLFGIAMAFGCAFEFIEIAQRRKLTISCPLIIPTVLLIAATQSRKALLILPISAFLVFFLYYIDLNHPFYSLLEVFIFLGITILLFRFLRSSWIFSGIVNRMEYLTNFFTGKGEIGYSMIERGKMVELGWEQFQKTPILGIGIDNAGLLTELNNDVTYTYLHNNYIELLCGGGLVGFIVYYSRYIFLQGSLFQNIHNKTLDFFPCEIMIIILLLLDYGRVSYYQKSSQIYFVLLFLQVRAASKASEPVVAENICRYFK